MSVRTAMPSRQQQEGLAAVGLRASMKPMDDPKRVGKRGDPSESWGMVNPALKELLKTGRTVPGLTPVYATHQDVDELAEEMGFDWYYQVGPGWRGMGITQRLDILATRMIQDHLNSFGPAFTPKRDIITTWKAGRLSRREIVMTEEAMSTLLQLRPDHVRRVASASSVDNVQHSPASYMTDLKKKRSLGYE